MSLFRSSLFFPDRRCDFLRKTPGVSSAVAHAEAAGSTSPITAAIDAAAGYFEADPRRVRILLREPQSSALLAGHRTAVLPGLLTELAGSAGVTDPSGG